MDTSSVLVAAATAESRTGWSEPLRGAGHRVETAGDAEECLGRLRADAYDLLFLDLGLAPGDGASLIEATKAARPATMVVAVSRGTEVAMVLAAFRAGAFDFLQEPLRSEQIREVAARAASRKRLGERRRRMAEDLEQERKRVQELEKKLVPEDPIATILGGSLVMRNLLGTLREVSRTDSTVLLTGESGTGKGLVARAIHEASARRSGPFVEANCVVYSEGVLHSELFGHERGAFTGAAKLKRGRFELAAGGTLFLDEIGEISPATQLLLLRVLQDRSFERVGGEETLEADVRLIAATNRDLQEAMRRGSFRSDLFYRLNVIPVNLPPLRERPEDVPVLAGHFLGRCAVRIGQPAKVLSPETLECMMRFSWPGNVRELENLVERMVVLSRSDEIRPEDLPASLREAAAGTGHIVPGTLQDMERRRILEALRDTGGNKKLAAARLGIHRSTLYAKMRRHGLWDGHDPESRVRRGARQNASSFSTLTPKS